MVLLTPHFCNWEWLLPAGGAYFGLPIDAVYQKQRVEFLDRFLRDARSRFGGKPIVREDFVYELMNRAGTPRGYALIADQTPPRDDKKHWSRFLNRDTAFFVGAEKVARFLDSPVLYVAMRRVGRGRYSVRLHAARDAALRRGSGVEDTPIMERFARHARNGDPRESGGLAVAAEAVEVSEAGAAGGRSAAAGARSGRTRAARRAWLARRASLDSRRVAPDRDRREPLGGDVGESAATSRRAGRAAARREAAADPRGRRRAGRTGAMMPSPVALLIASLHVQ